MQSNIIGHPSHQQIFLARVLEYSTFERTAFVRHFPDTYMPPAPPIHAPTTSPHRHRGMIPPLPLIMPSPAPGDVHPPCARQRLGRVVAHKNYEKIVCKYEPHLKIPPKPPPVAPVALPAPPRVHHGPDITDRCWPTPPTFIYLRLPQGCSRTESNARTPRK